MQYGNHNITLMQTSDADQAMYALNDPENTLAPVWALIETRHQGFTSFEAIGLERIDAGHDTSRVGELLNAECGFDRIGTDADGVVAAFDGRVYWADAGCCDPDRGEDPDLQARVKSLLTEANALAFV